MLDMQSFSLVCLLCVVLVAGQGVNLGKLHWCNTLCLCHDDTQEMMHCFTDMQIYSLLNVDVRMAQRLSKSNFRPGEKLTWCSETCLCHKVGRKEFKCSDSQRLGVFIKEEAPSLAHYLEEEEEIAEVYDIREVVEEEEKEGVEFSTEMPEKKDKHGRRKFRKHRKNRKKNHHDRREEDMEDSSLSPLSVGNSEEKLYDRDAPDVEVTSPDSSDHKHPDSHNLNAIMSQASTGRGTPSALPPEYNQQPPSPAPEVPLENQKLERELGQDLDELRVTVYQIKADVDMNQHILLVTVAVASVAIIGVLILSIYSCCLRRSATKHTITKPQRNHHSIRQQEDNNVTKANVEEAW